MTSEEILGLTGSDNRGPHGAVCDRSGGDRVAVESQADGCGKTGDVQIAASRHSVESQQFVLFRQRHNHSREQFARLEVELFVAAVEIVDIHQSGATAAGEFQFGVHDVQERQRIGDRRGVDDVAANRADVANLRRAKQSENLMKLRHEALARLFDGRPTRPGAEHQAIGLNAYALQIAESIQIQNRFRHGM